MDDAAEELGITFELLAPVNSVVVILQSGHWLPPLRLRVVLTQEFKETPWPASFYGPAFCITIGTQPQKDQRTTRWTHWPTPSNGRKVNWILDADIKGFFDHLDRERLISFLGERIGDNRVLRLIRKWLSTGVMEAGELSDSVQGTPQGAPISPLLANVYLHKVLDSWFAKEWRPKRASGEVYIVRYADDFVLGFQYRSDAVRFAKDLRDRLEEYGLELAAHKTRLIEFGRYAIENRRQRNDSRPETFDFLGLTHYCRTMSNGKFGLGRKPIAKRVRRTLKAIKERLRMRMHDDPAQTGQWLGLVLRGWLGYYAVPTSSTYLRSFKYELERQWLRSLRRRSQHDRFPWGRLRALSTAHLPTVSILHPWPADRFAVKHSS